ncbi:MAG TPA: hypothetical protein VHB25_04265, partial [Gemmatimonadaceae bacterium]|nr:hypothetical protein [Gemmatimonadaceae bacterium]
MRRMLIALAALAVAAPLAAQQQQGKDKDPTIAVNGGGAFPAGWSVALDPKEIAKGSTPAMVKFITMGDGYHFTTGPAAIYWRAGDVTNGAYAVSATFHQTKKNEGHGDHGEAYGLVVGGSKLGTPEAQYLYFIVRQDGSYMIRHRAGPDDKTQLHTIIPWTASDAVHKFGADGSTTNSLLIHCTGDSIHFIANGTLLRGFSKADMHGMFPEGLAGIRMNHNLDV